jgi:hypothetical protein
MMHGMPADTPERCLSVRQPWAWLIVNGHKLIENRKWPTRFRGRIWIHASKGMSRSEWVAATELVRRFDLPLCRSIPPLESIERGGIVGQVTLLDCVSSSDSPWFVGPFGFVLADATPWPFFPLQGALGIFRYHAGEYCWRPCHAD